MNTNLVVFLGPSCPIADASDVLNADFRPAAQRGDISSAVEDGATTIVLIDGRLIDAYAPSPREVFEAGAKGVNIIGAASLGALRAAELYGHGMLGYGWVYKQFLNGNIESDDELVSLFIPETGLNVTVPLIRVRYASETLRSRGLLDQHQTEALCSSLSSICFSERTQNVVRDVARKSGIAKDIIEKFFDPEFDIKRIDTLECLELIKAKSTGQFDAERPRYFGLNAINERQITDDDSKIESLEHDLRSRLHEFGITRIANTISLDSTGIPTFGCVKPGTSDVNWVYSGKGRTLAEASVSAIMECIERTSALWDSQSAIPRSINELELDGVEFWPPCRFTERSADYTNDTKIWWTEANRIGSTQLVLVPAELAFCGFRPKKSSFLFVESTTTGLAAAATLQDAVATALAEVIERDTVSCAELEASHYGVVSILALANKLGLNLDTFQADIKDNCELAISIERTTMPTPVAELIRQFEREGINVGLKAIPSDAGVPVFGATSIQEIVRGRFLGAAGYGINSSPERAAIDALLELAQSRTTDLQGAREDSLAQEKRLLTGAPTSHWLASASAELATWDQACGAFASTTAADELGFLLDATRRVGLNDIAVVRFPCYSGLYVARVLVPGAETWHSTGGQSNLGPRMARKLGVETLWHN